MVVNHVPQVDRSQDGRVLRPRNERRTRAGRVTAGLAFMLVATLGCEPASPIAEARSTPTDPLEQPLDPPNVPESSATPPDASPADRADDAAVVPRRLTPEEVTTPDSRRLTFLGPSAAGLPRVGLVFKGEPFDVELASTVESRARGMGGRRNFPPGTAMLFVNPGDRVRRYWMKDCLVDIDVAFIDRFGRITAMHRMPAEPARRPNESMNAYQARLRGYPSRRPARYALELPPGELDRLGFRVGELLPLPHAPLQATATAGP